MVNARAVVPWTSLSTSRQILSNRYYYATTSSDKYNPHQKSIIFISLQMLCKRSKKKCNFDPATYLTKPTYINIVISVKAIGRQEGLRVSIWSDEQPALVLQQFWFEKVRYPPCISSTECFHAFFKYKFKSKKKNPT